MGLLSSFIKNLLEYNSPNRIGERGEAQIAKKLGWISLLGREGKLLQNVYVSMPDGKTTEIDLLYITVKGIFVIESKNFAGYIFGDERNRSWTVTLYAGKDWLGRKQVEKHHFYNPIWQNNTHIKCLKQLVGENIRMISIVVFSDRSELKSISLSQPNAYVCNRAQLSRVIRNVWDGFVDVMTEEEVMSFYDRLLPFANVDDEFKQQHVDNIRSRINSIEICPRCGGKLVLRTARSGTNVGKQFYGCSNYPKCRHIKNLEQ